MRGPTKPAIEGYLCLPALDGTGVAAVKHLLGRAASSVPHPSIAQKQTIAKLTLLQERLEEGLLRVAVLGQFKRGKSTLLNALLGAPLLPAGVIPVTAIPTFIRAGAKPKARISFGAGKPALQLLSESDIKHGLEQHISEAHNPNNRLQVEKVEIEFPSEYLGCGILAIDTPGVGSTFLHNTQTAEAVLGECDAALFVVSADPPITEAEVNYLRQVQKLIPKIFFILNKKDLLNADEQSIAEGFLASVLKGQPGLAQPVRIFCVSGKQGLQAKQDGSLDALEESGIQRLQDVLANELAREKLEIVRSVARLRAISLVGDLLFQSELEHKALLTPQGELRQKASIFEDSASRFGSERQALADFIAVDRDRLLKELDARIETLWKKTQGEIRTLVNAITAQRMGEKEARDRLAAAMTQRFEGAFPEVIEMFKASLKERLAVHRERADALLKLVRQTAADLMEISISLPRTEEAFELKRTPYWVAAEASVSIIGLSASALASFLPRSLRERRLYHHLGEDAEKAVLRNIANLEWAVRRNIEDAFLHFEGALAEQLDNALQMTRQALLLALKRHDAKSEEMGGYVKEAAHSVSSLEEILAELQGPGWPRLIEAV
jgi:GTP-binding protein EngB required for normal cell division